MRKQSCPDRWTRPLDYRRRVLGCIGRDVPSLVAAHSQATRVATGRKRLVSDCPSRSPHQARSASRFEDRPPHHLRDGRSADYTGREGRTPCPHERRRVRLVPTADVQQIIVNTDDCQRGRLSCRCPCGRCRPKLCCDGRADLSEDHSPVVARVTSRETRTHVTRSRCSD